MKISFHGVRGFIPVPGARTLCYGGNTLSFGVETENGSLVGIDAGTGLSTWSRALMARADMRGSGKFNLIITHTGYEHVQGFSFFIPALVGGNTVNIYQHNDINIADVLESQVAAEFSPMQTLSNFGSDIKFFSYKSDEIIQIDELSIVLQTFPCGNSKSTAVKIQDKNSTAVFLTQVTHNTESIKKIIDFSSGADILIHDSFSGGDITNSSRDFSNDGQQAVEVASAAGVSKLILTRYHHSLDDKNLEDILKRCIDSPSNKNPELCIELSREGNIILI
ncbi:MAG: hypothetical protein JXR95_07985 [Deltaproteobacteria bacterium]|nr:hypothetical protein [Deltaproteobacteria bacterium]